MPTLCPVKEKEIFSTKGLTSIEKRKIIRKERAHLDRSVILCNATTFCDAGSSSNSVAV